MSKQTYTTGQVLTSAQMTQLQANDYNQTVSAKVASYTLVASDAGTRITMSNASATTITVNTSLFTAGDTLIITNIGAGVCTITAGTATVSTGGSLALAQYDSGTLYFTSTGVSIWNGVNPGDITGVTAGTGLTGGGTSGTVSLAIDSTVATLTGTQTLTNKTLTSPALTTPTISTLTTNGDLVYGTGSGALSRLGIGSSAQILTVASGIPSWATPSAGGGMTLLSTTNLTGAQTISITGISQSYKALTLYIENFSSTVDSSMSMFFNNDTTLTNYLEYMMRNRAPSTSADFVDQTSFLTGYGLDATTSYGFSYVTIPNYTSTNYKIYQVWSVHTGESLEFAQTYNWTAYNGTSAISEINIKSGTGNWDSGTVKIYGVN